MNKSPKSLKKPKSRAHTEQLIGSTVMGERGQIVIPKDIRDRMNIKPGAKMMVMQHGDSPIMLLPIEQMREMIRQMSDRVAKLMDSES